MNPEEIIKYLKMVRPAENYSHTFSVSVGNTRHFGPGSQLNKDVSTAIDLAIAALEKQVPKKPIHANGNYYCPTCKDTWLLWDDAIPNERDNFCPNCGQKINWGNEE